jgi:CHRD domain-containing protein
MRRYVPAVLGFALTACATAPTPTPEASKSASPEMLRATLDSGSEVPPPSVDPSASPSGTADFTVTGTSVSYKLSASGLSSAPLMAHIHLGAPGAAGPVVVPLNVAPGPSAGTATGEGTFDASAIKGKNGDGSPMTFDDLLAAMRSGATYVNVHTANNKPGEVRGQISK